MIKHIYKGIVLKVPENIKTTNDFIFLTKNEEGVIEIQVDHDEEYNKTFNDNLLMYLPASLILFDGTENVTYEKIKDNNIEGALVGIVLHSINFIEKETIIDDKMHLISLGMTKPLKMKNESALGFIVTIDKLGGDFLEDNVFPMFDIEPIKSKHDELYGLDFNGFVKKMKSE